MGRSRHTLGDGRSAGLGRVRVGWLRRSGKPDMRSLLKSSLGVVFVVCLLGVAPPVLAQQGTAGISGKVTDEQGAVLPGVSIVLTNEANGATREITSSAEGTYLASQLTPGPYKVVADGPSRANTCSLKACFASNFCGNHKGVGAETE